jgi:hypothetical protein
MDLLDYVVNKEVFDVDADGYIATPSAPVMRHAAATATTTIATIAASAAAATRKLPLCLHACAIVECRHCSSSGGGSSTPSVRRWCACHRAWMLLRGVHMACLSLTNMAMQSTVVTQGLGVEIDEAAVRRAAAAGHSWRDREWRLPDGTPTTW